MANKARHAFGNSENLQAALDEGKIDAYDIVLLDGATDPKVGWIDKNGNPVFVDNASGLREQVNNIETDLASKVSIEEVDTKIETVVTEKVENVVTNQVTEKVEIVVEEKIGEAMDSKIEEAVSSANSYTDEKFAEISQSASYEIIEF
jgi:hypothetical protein